MATRVERTTVRNPAGPLAVLGAINGSKNRSKQMPVVKKTGGKKKPTTKKNGFLSMGAKPKTKSTKKKPAAKPKANKPTVTRMNPEKIQPLEMLKSGSFILAGLIGARQLPQLVLGTDNSGWKGYLANFATAAIGGIGVGMALGARSGFAFAAGGTAYTLSRVATERFSPVGRYFALAGVGDAAAASVGDCKRAGMGIVVDSSFSYPMLKTPQGQILIPPHIQAAIDEARYVPPSASSQVAGARHRR